MDITTPDFGTNQLAAEVFSKLHAIVNAPGYPFLKHYKSDLMADAELLRHHYGPNSVCLWLARETGSDLCLLGTSEKDAEFAAVVLNERERNCPAFDIFALQGTSVRRVTLAQAKDLVKAPVYTCKDQVILSPAGERLCSFRLERDLRPGNGNLYAKLALESARPQQSITLGQLKALRRVAYSLAIKEFQSLFARVSGLTFDGQDLDRVIEEREALQTLQVA